MECTNLSFPNLKLYNGSTVENLSERLQVPILISLEVIEHVYAPRDYMKNILNLLEPGGIAIISTPYHGYLKNLLISLFGKMDDHFTALTDGGHIKFWSFKTLTQLLNEFKFQDIKFYRVGRFHPSIAKSMIVRFKNRYSENIYLILTFNEELNISRCIESTSDFDDIVVLDSYSTDSTVSIASQKEHECSKESLLILQIKEIMH